MDKLLKNSELEKEIRKHSEKFIQDLLKKPREVGKIKSVIDKTFPLSQTADAHRYYEEGHPKGKIVITMKHNNKT